MLASRSKYAIDARISGWFKPTYLELNQIHLIYLMHLKNSIFRKKKAHLKNMTHPKNTRYQYDFINN